MPIPAFFAGTKPQVLTIMREYRRCIEQAMAVIHLPIVIVGIHPVKKVMMLNLGRKLEVPCFEAI